MKKQWAEHIQSWKEIRAEADQLIKPTLKTHFPCKYGYPNPMDSPKSYQKEESRIGRALWVYARSDLTIKTMELDTNIPK